MSAEQEEPYGPPRDRAPGGPPPGGPVPPPMSDADARNLAMLAHLLTLLGWFAAGLGTFLPPLLIWLIKKDAHPLLEDQCKESLNFQITILIASAALVLITVFTCGVGLIITGPLLLAVAIYSIVAVILAAIAASRGEYARYWICIRFIT